MSRAVGPRRSVLYVPAANKRAMAKAVRLACDVVIYDLEDAVAADAKAEARASLLAHFGDTARPPAQEQVIRINTFSGRPDAEDMRAAVQCEPDALLLPKVEGSEILLAARRFLDASGGQDIRLWAMVETPFGIVNLREIAQVGTADGVGLDCLVAGVNDLAKETNLPLPDGRPTIEHWLSLIVIHARAFGMDVLDGVYNDLRDMDGFLAECRQGVLGGFDGKTLVHPDQIAAANTAFSPTEAALSEAQAIAAAFECPSNAGNGVLVVNGRMVERLHADMARRLIARAT
ncbi:CoA ester lyase [Aquamicrobium sp. NLF2-7]|uniref:HpcH/HpaI aldolase/citrate lyase family protein n=1 Tax=Aquamicrobium sp. NLF2-7 TaxID=2918753 RepID=UPI001EFAC227|nr:CoA ester lyase [Aquamicrobium sp. NLF2-7]MCG8274568.1 CoA ester lyase [Aquamicrobium sp. NLF2-7]MCG8274599.1 CoA ester lyase [Aquamicrobium sp. NLF2-7]